MVQISSTRLSWDDLVAIHAVAKAKSIRRAAEQLGLAHTTLARRIEAAEAVLGIVAFVRGTKGYALTAAGQAIVTHVDRMAEEADAMTRALTGGDERPQGTVRISLAPAVLDYCLLPALSRFRATYPGISLDFDTQYGYSNLDRQEADIAIRYQDAPHEHLVGICAGNAHESAYATADNIALNDGAHANLIGWSRGDTFVRRAESLGLETFAIAITCVDVRAQTAMAAAGMGIAILPTFVGDNTPGLRRVFPNRTLPVRPVWVLTHPDLQKSIRIRTVMAFLVAEMKRCLSGGAS